uniref:Uncharacterized protein n=1 Tax=Romanomermis culicivorax TaxID=13658 RepID=A0A915IXG5_ROMCU
MGLNFLRWNSLKKYFIVCLCAAGLVYEIQRWKFGNNNNKGDHYGKMIDSNLKNMETEEETDNILKRKFRILAEFVDPSAYKNLDVIRTHQQSTGHHLQNFCKYPVLAIEDPSIREHIVHNRTWTCKQVEPDLVIFDQKTGLLKFDRRTASDVFGRILASKISCQFRPFAGSLQPDITTIQHYGQWTYFHTVENGVLVHDDQFEVTCFVNEANSTVNPIRVLYRNAFAQVSFKTVENEKLAISADNLLSLDIVGLDSTSLNMFKRHMPRSWSFMMEKMGFLYLEGYNKVADNSMVNWVPIFLGKRYLNQSESEDMMDELGQWPDVVLELDQFDWLWKLYKG